MVATTAAMLTLLTILTILTRTAAIVTKTSGARRGGEGRVNGESLV
jgi:hypothetical protein